MGDGRLQDVVALQLPTGRRSGEISDWSEPILRQEALQALQIIAGHHQVVLQVRQLDLGTATSGHEQGQPAGVVGRGHRLAHAFGLQAVAGERPFLLVSIRQKEGVEEVVRWVREQLPSRARTS